MDTAASLSAPKPSGVLDRLRAHREARAGDVTFPLPSSGVVITFPRFRPYHLWQRAQRLGGSDADRMQLHYLVAICRFDGETIKANDYAELIEADDHIALVGRVFGAGGDDADPDEAGAGGEAGNA